MNRIMSMGMKEETKTLDNVFKEFYQIKKIQQMADKTLYDYKYAYELFSDFVGGNMLCSDISQKVIYDFIEHLQKKNPDIRATSINSYLRGIRAFLYFCMEQDYIKSFKISLIREEKKLKETYTEAELERLLKKPNIKKCSFAEYRNWVVVCYLLGTGNRLSTVINIKIGDLDFNSREIKLRTVKNKKQYIIPMSTVLEKTLKEYLTFRKGNEDDYLFCNAYGKQMTTDGLSTCIQRYNHSRGVLKTSIHLFRHTFAKRWILNGGDPFRLKTLLGHSTMAMTNEYVNMYGVDLQRGFDNFSPLDSMDCFRNHSGHIKMG